MEWVASTITLPWNMVHPALLPLMHTPRLPVVDLTGAPADLNGLVRFAERRNLFSVRVPSHFKRSLHGISYSLIAASAQNEETMGDFKRALSSKQTERGISI
jgi:hypothetical protein